MKKISGVLFDLDGTLIDTAPDFLIVLNKLLTEANRPPLTLLEMRHACSDGSAGLLKVAFGEDYPTDLTQQFLNHYMSIIGQEISLFPGVEAHLTELESRGIAWGIVTNKPTRFTTILIEKLGWDKRAKSVVCGDTLDKRKPHPEPIWHALKEMSIESSQALYIGDALRDIDSARAAGVDHVLALYGYLPIGAEHLSWQADYTIDKPADIEALL